MTDISRRRALKVLGLAPLALGAQQPAPPMQPHTTPNTPVNPPKPANSVAKRKFFTAKEARTASVLADDIIPRDGKSGSATESGVIDFIDFHMSVPETDDAARTALRGGLRWIDTESKRRFGVAYASATAAQRHAILDDISWPDKTRPEFRAGGAFFVRFRDQVASGFFSSPMGWKDVQYVGNTFNPNWNGCPPEANAKLGVTPDVMKTRVPAQ